MHGTIFFTNLIIVKERLRKQIKVLVLLKNSAHHFTTFLIDNNM